MTPLIIASITAVMMMAGALGGCLLRKCLSSRHFDEETQDVVKLGLGFVATLSALVMGLVISSSKASYDAKAEMVHTAAALVVQFDNSVRQMGPAAEPVRQLLKEAVAATMQQIWNAEGATSSVPDSESVKRQVGELERMLFQVSVTGDMQRQAQANALKVLADLSRINAVAFTQRGSDVITPLLTVVACWMMLNIAGWNLFAPANRVVMAVNLVCALSVASAIFLILEMDQPFDGIISISDASMRVALLRLSE